MRSLTTLLFVALLFAALLFAGCGGASPPAAPRGLAAQSVWLVQIDGLTPGLLADYLRRPTSRAADRALHRLLGATAPGGGEVRFERARVARGVTVLPSRAEPATATLITGRLPAEHGVRAAGDALAPSLPTLFERLGERPSFAAGLPLARGAGKVIEGPDDAARVAALRAALASSPRDGLVALRFDGLARALAAGGPPAGVEALAEVDRLLAQLLREPAPGRLVVFTAAHGAVPLAQPTAQGRDAFAKFLGVPADTLQPAGGLLRLGAIDDEKAAALAGLDFAEAVIRRDADGLSIYDRDLGRTRRLGADELPHPDLTARLEGLLAPGEWVALARRGEGYEFQVDAAVPRVGFGGATEAESVVPLIFAGPGLGAGDLGTVSLTAVAPTILDLLGAGGGPGSLAAALTAPVEPPAGSAWAACRADATACAAVIDTTDRREAAVEALRRTGNEPLADWLAGAARASVVEAPAARDEREAALVARVLGAEAVVLGAPPRVVAPTALLGDLGGPRWLAAEVARRDAYAALGRGARAFREGLYPQAIAALDAAAEGLAPDAERWRHLLRAWAGRRGHGEHPPVDLPAPFDGDEEARWTNALVALARALDGNVEADAGAPPLPAPEGWRPDRQRLLAALRPAFGVQAGGFCATGEPPARAAALDEAARALAADLPGLAALARARRIPLLADRAAARAELRVVLDLLRDPRAAWMRPTVAREVLLTAILANDQTAGPELDEAAAMLLLEIQRGIATDDLPDADDRNVARITSLVHGLGGRQPALLDETIRMGLGDRRDVATAVVRSVLAQGGLTMLFSPDLYPRLVSMLGVIDDALEEIRARPVGQLDGDERIARVVPHLLRALLRALEGRLPDAASELYAADRLLPQEAVLDARDAALKAMTDDEAEVPLAAWGPFVVMAVKIGRALVAGMEGKPDVAQRHIAVMVDAARALARRELARAGVEDQLGRHVDALAVLIAHLADVAFATEDPAARNAALKAAAEAARKLPLEVPGGEAETAGRWLVLTAVVARDALAVYESIATRRAPTGLEAPTRALESLAAAWQPEAGFGRGALMLLLAAQRTLPDLQRILDAGTDPARLVKVLPRIRDAVDGLARDIRAEYPEEKLRRALAEDDRVDLVLLAHLLALLEADVKALASGDALLARLSARNQELAHALIDRPGDARALLAMAQVWLETGRGRYVEAILWAEKGLELIPGTGFADFAFLWDLLAARAYARIDDPEKAHAALERAAERCPPVAWEIDIARALTDARAGRTAEAVATLRRARAEARRRLAGPVTAAFQLDVRDGHQLALATVQLPLLSVLLGRFTGTFQVGAGSSSNEQTQRRHVGWTAQYAGGPVDAAVETLVLEAWVALAGGDEAAADRALSRLTGIWMGADPRFVDEPADVPPLPLHVGPPRLRAPLELTWVAVLADLRGHRELARWLLSRVAEQTGGSWAQSPLGAADLCPENAKAPADEEDARALVTETRCQAPEVFLQYVGRDAAEALTRVVHLQMRRLHEMPVAPAAWRKALEAASRAAPALVPAWVPALQASLDARTAPTAGPADAVAISRLHLGDPNEWVTAARGGYPCEAALVGAGIGLRADALVALGQGCGPVGFRLQALLGAARHPPLPDAWAHLQEAIVLADRLPLVKEQAFSVAWPLARAIVLDEAPEWRAGLAERATELARLATRVGAPGEALFFRSVALAARLGADAEPAAAEAGAAEAGAVLREARTGGARDEDALRFLKQYLYAPDADARRSAADQLLRGGH